MDDLHIVGGRHWETGQPLNLAVADRHIRVATAAALSGSARQHIDASGWLVSPAFVEPHYHLDKVLVTEGALPGASFPEQVAAVAASKRKYTVDDVRQRARQIARAMAGCGISVIRTFADVDSYGGFKALEALVQLRQELRAILDLQIVAFPQHGLLSDEGNVERIEAALRQGADLLGGHPQLEPTAEQGKRHVELLFEMAKTHDRDLDFHVDENDDPQSRWLDMVVDATLRHGWQGRVNVAHCASLIRRDDAERRRLYEDMRKAGVTVVNSPTSALLFRGHGEVDPTRGVVPVRELLTHGVPVACAQEVYRSVFAPNLRFPDPVYTAQLMAYVAKMSDDAGLLEIWRMITTTPARSLRLPQYGLETGARANLVLFRAASVTEVFTRLGPNRLVLHDGKLIAESHYEERFHAHG